jgi:hypothetical protein
MWMIWVCLIDISTSPIAQKLCLYGLWSTFAFPVNGFLGLRVICPGARWKAPLARVCFLVYLPCTFPVPSLYLPCTFVAQVCFLVYLVCCAINWSLHLAWAADNLVAGTLRWQEAMYVVSLAVLVNDDLILMGWLRNFDPEAELERIDKLRQREAASDREQAEKQKEAASNAEDSKKAR